MRNTRGRRILLPLLALMAVALILTLLGGGFAIFAQGEHSHDGIEWQAWTSTTSLPSEAGSYYLTADVTISSTWNVPSGTTNLCLCGHSITRTNASGTTGSVINVGSGATLNLYDCGTETRYYVVADPTANGAGLGTVVDESTYQVADENAKGTFTGGYITGGVISGGLDNQHLIGGGVNVEGGAFTMYGGTIIGNRTCINSGGVKVKGAGASFTMNGGAIIANYNDCYGGGISVGDNGSNRLCTLVINGGTIARNWSGRNGGAIHTDGYNHTLIITGGSIVNNYTNGNYENGSIGRAGGGILKDGTLLTISGNPIIRDNFNGETANDLYLRSDKTDLLNLSGLTSGADVGISFKALNDSSDFKIATGAQKEEIQYLHYDIPREGCIIFCDGEKDWIYANGEFSEFNSAHHSHEAGTVWASVIPHEHDGLNFTKWTSTNSLPTSAGNYYLSGDVTISSTWNVPSGTTSLCLNGHGIKMTGNGSVVSVGNGATLNLYDCGDTVHKYTVDENHLATVNDALNGVNGVDYFTFTGGYITGGKMTAKNSAGGGVKVASGAYFTMNGGTIIGNSADMGGGVYCSNNFVMNGGTIRNNIAPAISGSGQRNGGGVYINTASSFTMNGGTITENWCANAGSGILLQTGAISFTMNGGAVVNNYNRGIGNNMKQKPVQLGSAAVVEGNVDANGNPCDIWLIQSGNKVQLLGERTNTTPIAVLMASPGVFTSGWATYMTDGDGNVADPSNYFVSNNSNYGVLLKDGEVAIGVIPHEHDGVTFEKWTSTNSLPTMAGNYYLASDVTISSTWNVPSGTVNLCLNDHEIKRVGATGADNSGLAITIGNGANLTVMGPGKITGGNGFHGGGIHVEGTGSLVLINCEISGNTGHYGGGLYLKSGTITLKDGAVVKENSASEGFGGSGIYAEGGGTLILEGGIFTGNEIRNGNQYAVFLCGNANVKVSGAPVIYDNTYNGEQKNLYLFQAGDQDSKVLVTGLLTDGTKIGVRQGNNTGTFTNGWSSAMGNADPSKYFISDNGNYIVNLSDGEATIKSHEHNGITFTKWASTNSLPTSGNYYLTTDITVSSTTTVSGTLNLCLNGHSITYTGATGTIFNVVGGGKVLNLYDCDETTHYYYIDSETNLGVVVGSAEAAQAGNADRNGTFAGGYITGGKGITTNPNVGGALYVGSGGVATLNGGTLIGNSTAFGGAIQVRYNSSFTMTGGAIIGNSGAGGAINADGNANNKSSVSILGGVIQDNTSGIRIGSSQSKLLALAGNVEIFRNSDYDLYISEERTIRIDGALHNTNKIVVKVGNAPRAFTTGWNTYMNGIEPSNVFIISDEGYGARLNASGEAEVYKLNFAVEIDGVTTYFDNYEDAFGAWCADKVGTIKISEGDDLANEATAQGATSVSMVIEKTTENAATNAADIVGNAKNKSPLTFFDVKVEKLVGTETTLLTETSTVLEIVIPYAKTNKIGITVYSYHGEEVKTYVRIESKDDKAAGTFFVDKANGLVYIYSNQFSTFAIGYTPYYSVSVSVSLGSFTGTATVTLENQEDGTVYKLEDADPAKIVFADVRIGKYIMTIVWEDGVMQTLTIPVTIGGSAAPFAGAEEGSTDLRAKETMTTPVSLSAGKALPTTDLISAIRTVGEDRTVEPIQTDVSTVCDAISPIFRTETEQADPESVKWRLETDRLVNPNADLIAKRFDRSKLRR